MMTRKDYIATAEILNYVASFAMDIPTKENRNSK